MRPFFILLLLLVVDVADAQVLRVAPGPVDVALNALARQALVRIVYAERLVEQRDTSCRYEGSDLDAAFACIVEGLPLQVVRRRQGQYVLRARELERDAIRNAPRRETLSGFVRDALTGEVLPGASVYVPRLRKGTSASAAGVFTLADLPSGAHRVRVSYVGYAVVDTVLLTQSPRNVVVLSPSSVLTPDVEVEGEAAAQPGLTDIPPALLEELPTSFGEADMLQRLTWLPGIERAGEATGGLVVRGGESDENLYLLDGAPVYHPWHAFSLVSTFQTDTFSRVRLFRSIYPAEFGGRISAVLDAEMRDGNRETPRAQAALGLLSGRYLIESPISRGSSFMLSGRRSFIDQIVGRRHPVVDSDGQRDTLRTGYVFNDLSAKVTWRPGFAHRISLSHYSGNDALDLRLPFDFSLDFDSWQRPADLFFEIDHGWGNQLQSLRYQYLPSTQLFGSATLYRSTYSARESSRIRPSEGTLLTSDYRIGLDEYGAKLGVEAFPRAGVSVRTGVHLAARRFRSRLDGGLEQPTREAKQTSERVEQTAFESVAYTQVELEGHRWRAGGGARVSTSSQGAYVFVDPNVTLAFHATDRLTLRAGAGRSAQYLHRLRDRFSVLYDLLSSRWIPADADVKPARARTAALGLEWRPQPGIRFDVEGYGRLTRHVLVPFDPEQTKDGLDGPGISAAALLGQYADADGRALGFEATAELIRGRWTAWAFYSGVLSERFSQERGDAEYQLAVQSIPHQIRTVVNRRMGRIDLGLSAEVRSGVPFAEPTGRFSVTDPVTGDPQYFLLRPSAPNARLPVYARLNATATWRFRLVDAAWQLRVDVYNVLNTRNTLDRTYQPTGTGVSISERNGLPILPLFELEVTL